MSDSELSTEAALPNTATLFTNTAGLAVFADRPFMVLMGYAESTNVIGKRLDVALGIDERLAQQMFEELRKAAHLDERLLEVRAANGMQLRLMCSGIASVDSAGKFLGADFRLRPPSLFVEEADETIVRVPIDRDPEVDRMFLQLYFTTRLKALYVLMGRLVGPQVNDRLDKLILDTAKRNSWNIQVMGGLFSSDIATTGVEVYKALLDETQRYAENLIGPRIVIREMAGIKSQLHHGVLDLASRYGLYEPEKDQ